MIRKIQKKKEKKMITINLSEEGVGEVQERGVFETVNEKEMENRKIRAEGKDEDVKVFTESISGLELLFMS